MPFISSTRGSFGPQGRFNRGSSIGLTSASPATSGTQLYNLGYRDSGVYWITAHGRRPAFQVYVALDDNWKGSVLVIKQAGRTLGTGASNIGSESLLNLNITLGEINQGDGMKYDDSVIRDIANQTTATVGILSYRDANFTSTTSSGNSSGALRLTDGKCWWQHNFSSFNYTLKYGPGTVYTTVDLGGGVSIPPSAPTTHTGWNFYQNADLPYSFITNHTDGYGFQNHTMSYSSDDGCGIFIKSST